MPRKRFFIEESVHCLPLNDVIRFSKACKRLDRGVVEQATLLDNRMDLTKGQSHSLFIIIVIFFHFFFNETTISLSLHLVLCKW